MPADYDIRTLEQELALLDGGEFLGLIKAEMQELRQTLRDHQTTYGGKPKGKVTLILEYEMNKSGDVLITGDLKVAPPKSPKASGAAFVGEDGQMSLHSPLLTRAHTVRDASDDRPVRDAHN